LFLKKLPFHFPLATFTGFDVSHTTLPHRFIRHYYQKAIQKNHVARNQHEFLSSFHQIKRFLSKIMAFPYQDTHVIDVILAQKK
jgi:hypothetical protein